jgi:hypothetical protein
MGKRMKTSTIVETNPSSEEEKRTEKKKPRARRGSREADR